MSGRKAVYFINTDRDFGYVACNVWDILEEEGYFTEKAGFTFENLPEEEREPMRMFSFICTLAFDVYVKKQIIESLIDEMAAGKNMQEK